MNRHSDDLTTFHEQCFSKYLTLWVDESGRRQIGLSPEECAYLTMAHAGSLERYRGEPVYLEDVIDPPGIRRMIVEGSAFALRFGLEAKARAHLADERDDELVALVMERDFQECFLSVASRLAKPAIDEGDSELLAILSEAGRRAIQFDRVFDEENEEVGIRLSRLYSSELSSHPYSPPPSRSQCEVGMATAGWMSSLPYPPPPSRAWWYHKAFENAAGRVQIIHFPVFHHVDEGVLAVAASTEPGAITEMPLDRGLVLKLVRKSDGKQSATLSAPVGELKPEACALVWEVGNSEHRVMLEPFGTEGTVFRGLLDSTFGSDRIFRIVQPVSLESPGNPAMVSETDEP